MLTYKKPEHIIKLSASTLVRGDIKELKIRFTFIYNSDFLFINSVDTLPSYLKNLKLCLSLGR